jgi:serine protease Do
MLRALLLAMVMTTWAMSSPVRADIETFRAVALSVVKISTTRTTGGSGVGSGVVIAPGKVVTNCHVTRDAEQIFILRGELRWKVTGQHGQPQRDVCVLEVPKLTIEPVLLAPFDALKRGDAVMAVGFSLGLGVQFADGVVNAMYPFDGGSVIQTDAGFLSGASGGGLFDERGRLVGLLAFRLPTRGAYFFALPLEWLSPALSASAEYAPVAPVLGARPFWEGKSSQLPYFLRATSLEAAKDWSGLLELTGLWLEEEPDSGDAKTFREKAQNGN